MAASIRKTRDRKKIDLVGEINNTKSAGLTRNCISQSNSTKMTIKDKNNSVENLDSETSIIANHEYTSSGVSSGESSLSNNCTESSNNKIESPVKKKKRKSNNFEVKTKDTSLDLSESTGNNNNMSDYNTDASESHKRRRKNSEMTLEERLSANSSTADKLESIPGDLVMLLERGLKKKDQKIINKVLQNSDTAVIRSTTKALSRDYVTLLIRELTKRLHSCSALTRRTLMQWVDGLLSSHKAFLSSLPDSVEVLQSLQTAVSVPTELLERLQQVNVQIRSLLAQGANADTSDLNCASSNHNDLADEEIDFEELNHDEAMSEEEWENMENSDDESDDTDNKTDDDDDNVKSKIDNNDSNSDSDDSSDS